MTQTVASWYRNAGKRTRYHLAASGWIQSGLAVCGASIRHPAYVADRAEDIPSSAPTCKRCGAHAFTLPDKRYVIAREYTGHLSCQSQFVVRFCRVWVGSAETWAEASAIARAHDEKRQKILAGGDA